MPQDVRIWKIEEGNKLREIKKAKLDLEERIEDWIEKDISIVSSDLLVIGRQVETDFGGVIDLLCLDSSGDVVIIELKRGRTPREVTAQVLDYASWVKDLSNEKITDLANKYLGEKGPLEKAFQEKFGEELPEILNEHHKMMVIATEIDQSTERIIEYLSNTYGVGINAVTFKYFRDEENKEYLARVFLIEPSQVEYRTQTKSMSKRKPPLTYEELEEMARANGVEELYNRLAEGLMSIFDMRKTTRSTLTFIGIINGNQLTIFHIIPGESQSMRIFSGKKGSQEGLGFQVYIDRLAEYIGVGVEDLVQILPSECKEIEAWRGGPRTLVGYFRTLEEIDRFLDKLTQFKNQGEKTQNTTA
ncbi:DUF91 domain-containing protein [candidate division KSB1 bacterium]|nr:MAG: DUF91 domain-containing protein [candidate division KSB1 bacterium]